MITLALFSVFVALIVLGVPIAISLGLACILTVIGFDLLSPMVLIQKMFGSSTSFSLMAIPLFILAGNIMAVGGVSTRLVNLASTLLGKKRGGLALVSTLACTFFGAISGSAPATTAAIGGVMIKPMVAKGYGRAFSAAVVSASGTIGLIIPPSITMVLYGVATGVSISKLFLAGIIPGIIMCIALMILEYTMATKRGYAGGEDSSFEDIIKAFKESFFAILMPVIIIGGIYGGIFTPTEAAAVACIYSVIIGMFVYKELDIASVKSLIISAAKSSAVIMYLMVTADIFGFLLISQQIPQQIAIGMISLTSNPLLILFMISFILLVVGTFLSNSAAVLLLTPIFFPIIQQVGIDPIFFGILMVVALAIGHNTPPVGLCLFVACDIADITIEEITKAILPFLGVLVLVLIFLHFVPGLILWLPNLIS